MDIPNRDSTTIMMSFDICKAFDMVQHDKLIETLVTKGLSDQFIKLINNYLKDRTQRLAHSSFLSDQLPITSGVPQGSVLGPVLFNIYISSLKPISNSTKYVKFADDTTFLLTIPKATDVLEAIKSEFNHVQNWCSIYGLSLNNNKTKIMSFRSSRAKPKQLELRDFSTYVVPNIKIVGFTFDEKLNWQFHIDNLIKTLSSRVHIFRLLKHALTKSHLINLYFGIFQSLLDYSFPIYYSINEKSIQRLTSIQNRVHRVICGHECKDGCLPDIISRRNSLSNNLFQSILNSPDHILSPLLPNKSPRSNRFILPTLSSDKAINNLIIQNALLYNKKQ
jgi:Reverse transcriptase (RNA-dependent DNA polymerase)